MRWSIISEDVQRKLEDMVGVGWSEVGWSGVEKHRKELIMSSE